MACLAKRLHPDEFSPARLTLERSQHDRLTTMYRCLSTEYSGTVANEELESLGICWGASLDVDNLSARDAGIFFSPCDWPQDVLEWDSHPDIWGVHWGVVWVDCSNGLPLLWPYLMCGEFRFKWCKGRLLALETLANNVWEPAVRDDPEQLKTDLIDEIKEHIDLELPERGRRNYFRHQYRGVWAYFVKGETDKPHSVCVMLDSSDSKEGVVVRSEMLAAVRMAEFQVRRACYTHHFVKPVLVCTYFRNQTARLTQVHFDMKRKILVLRQSRSLDLSGDDASPDAWLLLRWMACVPVGETLYQPLETLPALAGEDGANRPPQILVSG